ncbi:hypothetical protein A1O1_07022 [Capronia coronata CBS 617.96]|uniref:Uncharacterized protein n=1 Tax=Capronia coronata CBS 617.96 TaxID=1182541 RepID=W9Y1B2_9EURO|nr:uncharacterized protein A1O1_07022 [Capronia coronata CBS 617.96]EXJ83400.1 hypothetical protein A1O1_07022 [Capronia coronata CBS 617.96]
MRRAFHASSPRTARFGIILRDLLSSSEPIGQCFWRLDRCSMPTQYSMSCLMPLQGNSRPESLMAISAPLLSII